MPKTAMAGPALTQTSAGRPGGLEDASGGMATQQEVEAVKARATPTNTRVEQTFSSLHHFLRRDSVLHYCPRSAVVPSPSQHVKIDEKLV